MVAAVAGGVALAANEGFAARDVAVNTGFVPGGIGGLKTAGETGLSG